MNDRLDELVESANHSDCWHGCAPLQKSDCSIFRDYGWSHAIEIPEGFLCEVENTGWFFCETEAEAIEAIEAD